MIAFGLLVVVFLAVQAVSSTSTMASGRAEAMIDPRLSGSDWIERNPSKLYVGSDWIERHPSGVSNADYYAGSDWIERHPPFFGDANYYGPSNLEVLARIKDDLFPVNARPTGLSRLEQLMRIKDLDLIP
jgi:hypothetical protein